VKSNAITIAKDRMLVGAGAGQMDRVAAARIAIGKAGDRVKGSVAASGSPSYARRNAVGRSSAVAQPQGVVCFTTHVAGVANSFTAESAPSASSRLMYDNSLPCNCLAYATEASLVLRSTYRAAF
jgi:hypothetical protein